MQGQLLSTYEMDSLAGICLQIIMNLVSIFHFELELLYYDCLSNWRSAGSAERTSYKKLSLVPRNRYVFN